jgi:hypothetical protein
MIPGAGTAPAKTAPMTPARPIVRVGMRAHAGLVLFVVAMVVGVVLEAIGQNLIGTLLLLGTVWLGLGAARSRSRDAMNASTGGPLLRPGRRPPR